MKNQSAVLLALLLNIKSYPLSWEEQHKRIKELPPHLQNVVLFAINTGCRESEICNLQWEDEVQIPELDTSVFIIPAHKVKNREDRLDLLGHKSGRITTRYSAVEVSNLIDAANSVCSKRSSPTLALLKERGASSRKSPAKTKVKKCGF